MRDEHIVRANKQSTKSKEKKLKDPKYVKYSSFIQLLILVESERASAERRLVEEEDLEPSEIEKLKRDIIVYNCIAVQSMIVVASSRSCGSVSTQRP